MTTVAAATVPGQGTTAPLGTSLPAGGGRAAPPRLDFRLLLREQALTRPNTVDVGARAGTRFAPATQSVARGGGPPAGATADDPSDPLDARERHRASLAPPESLFAPSPMTMPQPPVAPFVGPPDAPVAARATASLEDLLPALVRRVAWSGDGHRGTLRLELGAGELAGGTLLVHADAGRVRVHLQVPAGTDAPTWQRRIRERLAARGIATDGIEVT